MQHNSFPSIDVENTGEYISELKNKHGLSVYDLQKACGFRHPQAVYKWMKGQTIPSVENLVILARLFGTSIDDLVKVK